MTLADTPTECVTPRPRERVLGPNRHTCKEVNEKDARIRELAAQVQDGLDTWPAFGITNGQRQWRLQAKAALARSEGKA